MDFYSRLLPILFEKYEINMKNILKLHRKVKQEQRTKIYTKFSNLNSGILLTTDVSARGLDIPNVDWIVQFDPPQDSNQYIHRIGRTARAGNQGQSMIFLQEQEDSYVKFLEKRKVDIRSINIEPSLEVKNIREFVYKQMKLDRDLIDKSQNAFVSFIRYYKEHELKFIFPFNQLQIGHVANSFFLFRMPRIKEILGKKWQGFQSQAIDIDSIKYKDKNRQKQKETMDSKLEFKAKREEKVKLSLINII